MSQCHAVAEFISHGAATRTGPHAHDIGVVRQGILTCSNEIPEKKKRFPGSSPRATSRAGSCDCDAVAPASLTPGRYIADLQTNRFFERRGQFLSCRTLVFADIGGYGQPAMHERPQSESRDRTPNQKTNGSLTRHGRLFLRSVRFPIRGGVPRPTESIDRYARNAEA